MPTSFEPAAPSPRVADEQQSVSEVGQSAGLVRLPCSVHMSGDDDDEKDVY